MKHLRPGSGRWNGRQLAGAFATLAVASGSAWPASLAHDFNVSVNLQAAKSCASDVAQGPHGQGKVTLSCSEGPSERYVVRFHGHALLGEVSKEAGTGTTTSWRVVRAADRDYLEVTIGW